MRLVSKGQQARSCCHHEAGRAICSWGGLDDVSRYGPGDDRVSCRRGTAKPDGPQYPRRAWLSDRRASYGVGWLTLTQDWGQFVLAASFFHLRQIRRVRQSLDAGSATTPMQAFMTSRVECCNAVLAESPRAVTDKLQRVMNSAARVISNTRKFGSRLSRLHDELHWLDVTDRVRFKLAVLMYRCLHGTAPPYLMDSCTPTADVTGRQHLRSATQRKLTVPVSVVGVLLLRARRLGIRCLTAFVTHSWVSTLSNVNWRHTFLPDIDDKTY